MKAHAKTTNSFFTYFSIYKNNKYLLSKNKERLSKKAQERHWNLSGEEKDKKYQYASEQCKNLSEDGKERCQYDRDQYKNLLEDGFISSFSRNQEIKTRSV